ncbi:hypothetical protein HED60_16055 [Planctomycetales bacterium ZRK34]|nr:hypothetical protein HED60_16055 [Planctomycetales bacterium ZRK34]
MPKPSTGLGTVIIEITGHEDVPMIVSNAAIELELSPDQTNPNRWLTADQHFFIELQEQHTGRWKISLIDWPSFARSDLSVRAEQIIRRSLAKAIH